MVTLCTYIFPRLARETQDDIEIDGKIIPKGAVVVIPVWAIHHNKDIYPDPELFDPERSVCLSRLCVTQSYQSIAPWRLVTTAVLT